MSDLRGHRAYRGQSHQKLQAIADTVRVTLGVGPVDRLPMLDVFERLHRYEVRTAGGTLPLWYEVEDDRPMLGVDAFADYDPEHRRIVIHLAASVYEKLEVIDGRPFFTVAHEIGHAVLHPQELIDRATVPVERGFARPAPPARKHSKPYDTEWQADGFAGAFLAPACGITAADLADPVRLQRFGLSRDAARVRASVINDYFLERKTTFP